MPRVRHVHSSGRYNRPKGPIRRALDRHVTRDKVKVLTLTECNNDRHRAALAEWAMTHHFDVAQAAGDTGNCAIAVDAAEWVILRQWDEQLTEHEQRRGPGGPPPPHAVTVLAEHTRTGKRMLVSVAHLPSHVEGDWSTAGPFGGFVWRVFVWRDAVARWKRHLRVLRKHHPRAKLLVVADWNLNFERPAFRHLVKVLFPRLRLTWREFPGPGTHHGRVIDASLTDMHLPEWEAEHGDMVHGAALLPDDDSSDHRPYGEDLWL